MALETLAHTYTSRAELGRVLSINGLEAWLDDDGDGSDESDIVSDVINETTDYINLYCEGWYETSDMADNLWVRSQAKYIGCYFLSQRKGNPALYTAQFDRITKLLEKIHSGTLQIPRLSTKMDLTPALSNVRVDDRFRIAKTRVQPSISTGGSDSSQHVDPNYPYEHYGP